MAELDHDLEALKERGWRQVAAIDEALEKGEIDEDGWYRATAELIVPAYLAGANARAQSGHSGDDVQWENARRLVLDAVDVDGSFLDVGCASGHLMECVQAWAAEDGIALEPWGLDISPELVALARQRLPQWEHRIFAGNALDWVPTVRFDFVRTNLDYVPERRQAELVGHVLEHVLVPRGRLIIGVFNEEKERARKAEAVSSWGFVVSGRTERPHPRSEAMVYRAFWLDAPAR